ncbi:hypothetical protein [Leeia oryzae]|uniref:hypothetical protein n=1 Tax=Leeia oryzae TaxID=356662 RepID=UPI0003670975|nr:hypothetical protein [Leeia oryzae]
MKTTRAALLALSLHKARLIRDSRQYRNDMAGTYALMAFEWHRVTLLQRVAMSLTLLASPMGEAASIISGYPRLMSLGVQAFIFLKRHTRIKALVLAGIPLGILTLWYANHRALSRTESPPASAPPARPAS